MDIRPLVPEGRQVIEGYGAGRFRVSGALYEGSVLVTPATTLGWAVRSWEQVDLASLEPLFALDDIPEILILGCGPAMAQVPRSLREAVRARGPVLEPMDSGAACRTYNVLLSEERSVAAALIAVE
jgi:uncharacterized protein